MKTFSLWKKFCYKFCYKFGIVTKNGDSIRRLKRLQRIICKKKQCSNKFNYDPSSYNMCIQPEVCFYCKDYWKATNTTADDYGWAWHVKKKGGE